MWEKKPLANISVECSLEITANFSSQISGSKPSLALTAFIRLSISCSASLSIVTSVVLNLSSTVSLGAIISSVWAGTVIKVKLSDILRPNILFNTPSICEERAINFEPIVESLTALFNCTGAGLMAIKVNSTPTTIIALTKAGNRPAVLLKLVRRIFSGISGYQIFRAKENSTCRNTQTIIKASGSPIISVTPTLSTNHTPTGL